MKFQPDVGLHPWESDSDYSGNAFKPHSLPNGDQVIAAPTNSELDMSHVAGTVVRFIFWTHDDCNGSSVLPYLQGCDILAFEGIKADVYDNVSDRQLNRAEDKDTHAIASLLVTGKKLDNRQEARMLRRGFNTDYVLGLSYDERKKELEEGLDESNYRTILINSMDRIGQLVCLDIGYKQARYYARLCETEDYFENRLADTLYDAYVDWDELVKSLIAFQISESNTLRFRDRVVAGQIRKLARENPGAKITVLYGRAHNTLTRAVGIGGISMQRFVLADTRPINPMHRASANTLAVMRDHLRAGLLDDEIVDFTVASLIATEFGPHKVNGDYPTIGLNWLDEALPDIKRLWQIKPKSEAEVARRLDSTYTLVENLLSSQETVSQAA